MKHDFNQLSQLNHKATDGHSPGHGGERSGFIHYIHSCLCAALMTSYSLEHTTNHSDCVCAKPQHCEAPGTQDPHRTHYRSRCRLADRRIFATAATQVIVISSIHTPSCRLCFSEITAWRLGQTGDGCKSAAPCSFLHRSADLELRIWPETRDR